MCFVKIVCVTLFFYPNLDKIYEARHKLLNLYPEPVVQSNIPPAYFSSFEQDFNSSALVEILSSVPNSPLTPGGLIQNFTPTFPNPTFSNKIGGRVQDFPNLTPANLRYHAMQQQSLHQHSSHSSAPDLITNEMQTYSNVSPRSMNANTSGYLSQLSHMGSLNISGSSNSLEQPSGNAMNNFKHLENQVIMGTPTNTISRHLTERDTHTFEMDNRLLTPAYHTVSNCGDLFVSHYIDTIFFYSPELWTLIGNELKA